MNEVYQPTAIRKHMCVECPHKQMHEQTQIMFEYPDTPHPCHMMTGYACRGAFLELKLQKRLNPNFEPDFENGV